MSTAPRPRRSTFDAAEAAARGWPTVKRRHRAKHRRIALRVAYDGQAFRGFQRQPGQRTVEGDIVLALERLGWSPSLAFASRTDAGVHARGQVLVLRVEESLPLETVQAALSSEWPSDLRIEAIEEAPPRFHPRWSATGKRYEYDLRRHQWAGGHLPDESESWARLDAALAELRAAPHLAGFTAAGAPMKDAPALTGLRRDGPVLVFEGPAFRRYAIRHMVGAAVAQASGEHPEGACAALALQPPPYRGPRADGDGLTLVEVYYPAELDPFARR